MNTFNLQTLKTRLVDTAIKLEQLAMVGSNRDDWNECISVQKELAEARQKYLDCRRELGWSITNQYHDEVTTAIDAANIALLVFTTRLPAAA